MFAILCVWRLSVLVTLTLGTSSTLGHRACSSHAAALPRTLHSAALDKGRVVAITVGAGSSRTRQAWVREQRSVGASAYLWQPTDFCSAADGRDVPKTDPNGVPYGRGLPTFLFDHAQSASTPTVR